MKKQIISWLLVVIWMSTIYYFSNMNSIHSNNISKSAIEKTIEITDKNMDSNVKMRQVNTYNLPVRKITHFIMYFILSLLIMNALHYLSINNKIMILLCLLWGFFYACGDEYHQTFILGRTGQIRDVLIDFLGIVIGCLIYTIGYRVIELKKTRINQDI